MPTRQFVTIEDREASHLNVGHIARDLLDLLIVETIFDIFGHDVTHFGFRAFPLGNSANHDVAIGNHAYQVILLADGEHPGIETGHRAGGLLNRFFWTGDANVLSHRFTYFHCHLLLLFALLYSRHLNNFDGAVQSAIQRAAGVRCSCQADSCDHLRDL
jgi:hypothetical protein